MKVYKIHDKKIPLIHYEDTKPIRCNNCMNTYKENELIRMKDKEGYFDGCEVCKSDYFLMNVNP